MVDSIFGKKYKLESSDKFDEYMKALGKEFSLLILITFAIFLFSYLLRCNLQLFNNNF